jgi:hypothetical protein
LLFAKIFFFVLLLILILFTNIEPSHISSNENLHDLNKYSTQSNINNNKNFNENEVNNFNYRKKNENDDDVNYEEEEGTLLKTVQYKPKHENKSKFFNVNFNLKIR